MADINSVKRLLAMCPPGDVLAFKAWMEDNVDDEGAVSDHSLFGLFYFQVSANDSMASAVGGDDLSAVIQSHLHIENMMEQMLRLVMPNADAILEDNACSFDVKKRILRRLNVITKEDAKRIDSVNEVRNAFAHNLQLTLTAEHDVALTRHLDAGDQMFVEKALQVMTAHVYPGNPARMGMWATYLRLKNKFDTMKHPPT